MMVLDQVAMCFRGNLLPVILMTLAITACLPCCLAVPGGESGDEGLGEGTSPGDQCYLAYWMTK